MFGARARIIRPDATVPYWRLETPGDGERYIQIRCARLWDTGSPVTAEAIYLPPHEALTYIRVTADTWSDSQIRRAGAGVKLLRGLARGPGGRRRLEDSPSSAWRAQAEQALDLIAAGEVQTIPDAAVRLNMPAYDEDHPELDGRAEKTAARRLSRYIQRLSKSDDQTE